MEHPEGDVVFRHACKLRAKGIVSKRLGSCYRSGRSLDWLNSRTRQRLL
jgi:bifunctional non-homologous end joining protein LigD